MTKISDNDVLEIIRKALNPKQQKITLDSTSDNVEEWDSLGHLGILVALDKVFDKKVGRISEMASAGSVKKILQLLKDNSLI